MQNQIQKISNSEDIMLPIAAWLAHDEYSDGANLATNGLPTASATTLIKPTRQSVLAHRLKLDPTASGRQLDVTDFIAANFGRSVHDTIENFWLRPDKWKPAMQKLGYPSHVIDRIVVNPSEEQLKEPDIIPVYVEGRISKEFEGFNITGKYDMIFNGELIDFKSTSTYGYIQGSNKQNYILQGSIYRWLNPDKIKADHVKIGLIFTDWQRMHANKEEYPSHRIISELYPLLSIPDTEIYLRERIRQYRDNLDKDQSEMIQCTAEDLWKRTTYKYFADPAKAQDPSNRSTRTFQTLADAQAHLIKEGKGAIAPVTSEPKACDYCVARTICSQYTQMVNTGEITTNTS